MLDGAKSVVTHGDCADTLVVSARTSGERDDADGITLFLVDAGANGVARRGYTMRDEQRAAEVSLSGVQVGADAVLGEVGNGLALIERVIEAGIAATAAESVGAMEALHSHDAGIQPDARAVRQADRRRIRWCSTGWRRC